MSDRPRLDIPDVGMLATTRTRRDVLKLMGMGGALVLLPAAMAACDDDDDPTGNNNPPAAGSGSPLVIDFGRGDVAILQYAYALEQLEADFYTKVVAQFTSAPAAEMAILTDIRNHEVIHREYLKAVLGTTNGFTLNTTYGNLNFNDRTSVLNTAKTFEDLGVSAYNGAAQYLTLVDNLLYAGKIVSVEARHASTISDLISPKTSAFAPKSFDDATRPGTVVMSAQGFIVEKLTPQNAPATFVQGPNNNG